MEKPRRGKWTWRGVPLVPLTRTITSSLFNPTSVPTVGWFFPTRREGEVRTEYNRSMKGPLAGISGRDSDSLTKGESESPRLCNVKSGMTLHVSRLDQPQGLITRQFLHGGGIRSLSSLKVFPQAGNPLSFQSGLRGGA